METSAYIALSRQTALRREMDVVANNIANMNTTAFKGEKMMFVEHLEKSRGGDSFIPTKLAYTRDIAQFTDLTNGPIQVTGNAFDVAIKGDGYFVIETEDGERYTRNGRFQLNDEGQLVNQQGQPVMSDAGTPFFFGPEDQDIQIARDGTVGTENGVIGKIRLVSFENPQELRQGAGGLMSTDATPQDVETPEVLQSALEGSNIEGIIEITRMIEVQRSYESVRKFIEAEDKRLKEMMGAMRSTSA